MGNPTVCNRPCSMFLGSYVLALSFWQFSLLRTSLVFSGCKGTAKVYQEKSINLLKKTLTSYRNPYPLRIDSRATAGSKRIPATDCISKRIFLLHKTHPKRLQKQNISKNAMCTRRRHVGSCFRKQYSLFKRRKWGFYNHLILQCMYSISIFLLITR